MMTFVYIFTSVLWCCYIYRARDIYIERAMYVEHANSNWIKLRTHLTFQFVWDPLYLANNSLMHLSQFIYIILMQCNHAFIITEIFIWNRHIHTSTPFCSQFNDCTNYVNKIEFDSSSNQSAYRLNEM